MPLVAQRQRPIQERVARPRTQISINCSTVNRLSAARAAPIRCRSLRTIPALIGAHLGHDFTRAMVRSPESCRGWHTPGRAGSGQVRNGIHVISRVASALVGLGPPPRMRSPTYVPQRIRVLSTRRSKVNARYRCPPAQFIQLGLPSGSPGSAPRWTQPATQPRQIDRLNLTTLMNLARSTPARPRPARPVTAGRPSGGPPGSHAAAIDRPVDAGDRPPPPPTAR